MICKAKWLAKWGTSQVTTMFGCLLIPSTPSPSPTPVMGLASKQTLNIKPAYKAYSNLLYHLDISASNSPKSCVPKTAATHSLWKGNNHYNGSTCTSVEKMHQIQISSFGFFNCTPHAPGNIRLHYRGWDQFASLLSEGGYKQCVDGCSLDDRIYGNR